MPETPFLDLLVAQLKQQRPVSEREGRRFIKLMATSFGQSQSQSGQGDGQIWDMIFHSIHMGYAHREAPGFRP